MRGVSNLTAKAFFLSALSFSTLASGQTPSFDCRKAATLDERAICSDRRLAELDLLTSTGFNLARRGEQRARVIGAAREFLQSRRSCGPNKLCILDRQVESIRFYQGLGISMSLPDWVLPYRAEMMKEFPMVNSAPLPKRIGQCIKTRVRTIADRFGEQLKLEVNDEGFDTGASVTFANNGFQVSYQKVPELYRSRVGDEVLMCLVSIPKGCPPGDDRGRVYTTTNLRTQESWTLPDAQHMCGGA